jgi:hypothetical protein
MSNWKKWSNTTNLILPDYIEWATWSGGPEYGPSFVSHEHFKMVKHFKSRSPGARRVWEGARVHRWDELTLVWAGALAGNLSNRTKSVTKLNEYPSLSTMLLGTSSFYFIEKINKAGNLRRGNAGNWTHTVQVKRPDPAFALPSQCQLSQGGGAFGNTQREARWMAALNLS